MSEPQSQDEQPQDENSAVERIVVPIEPGAAAIRDRVERDYREAMHQRDQTTVETMRLLRAAIRELEVARTDQKRRDFGQVLTEADVVGVIEKQVKQREEAAEAFARGGRPERAAAERAEGEILRRFLPAKLSRDEIATVVRRLAGELGPDFRKVMPAAAKELKGKADGRLIQEVVREVVGG